MSSSDTALVEYDDKVATFALKTSNNGATGDRYPLDADIYVQTGTFAPTKVREWLRLEVKYATPTNDNGEAVTAVQARLHDGSDQYYWDGAAWVTASDGDWNTIQEVSDNIGAWTAEALGVVLNLLTTDPKLTPKVNGFKLLYTVDIVSFKEDWIYDVVVKQLADEIRPLTDYIVSQEETGTTVSAALEGWDIEAIDGIWNEDADPDHATDISSSYNSGTKIATLTGSVDSGAKLFIRASYVPTVAVNTSPDYIELANNPSITFTNIQAIDLGEVVAYEYVMDRYSDPPTAAILPAPRRYNIDFVAEVVAPLAIDLNRITESLAAFIQNNRVLVSSATGQRASLTIVQDFNTSNQSSFEEVHTASLAFRLENVYMWHKPITSGFGVASVNTTTTPR